jgi:hypothetical protein
LDAAMVAPVRNTGEIKMRAQVRADIRELSGTEIDGVSGGTDNSAIGQQIVDSMWQTILNVDGIIRDAGGIKDTCHVNHHRPA